MQKAVIYHEEPQHVIQALVETSKVFDASNPGEYFYHGPDKKGKEIYTTKGDEYEKLDEFYPVQNNNNKKRNGKINKYLYHTSSPKNRESIFKNGLIPKKGEEGYKVSGGAIFATNIESAEDLFFGNNGDIWQIDTTKIPNHKWVNDDNFEDDSIHVYTQQQIPTNALKLIEYNSLKENQDMVVEGAILDNTKFTFKQGTEDEWTISAFYDGEIAGRIAVGELTNMFWKFETDFSEDKYDKMFPHDSCAEIIWLQIYNDGDRSFRGEGIAKKLINIAINKIKKKGFDRIYLNASPIKIEKGLDLNDLVGFYKSFGFKEILHQGTNVQMLLSLKNDIGENTEVISEFYSLDDESAQELIQKITNRLGLPEAKLIGQGNNGYAYAVGNNKVLKLTTDISEYTEAIKIKGKKNKHIADIYEGWILGGEHDNLVVILLEQIDTRNQGTIEYWDDATSYFWNKVFGNNKVNYHTFIRQVVMGEIKNSELQKIKALFLSKLKPQIKNFAIQYFDMIEELKKLGVTSSDFAPQNMGYKNGNLAYLDLGFGEDSDSEFENQLHLDETQIRKRVKDILSEVEADNNGVVFHYLDEKKLINILTKNEIKPRWKHYIESENNMIIGTSMTWDENNPTIKNMDYPIKLILNRKLIEEDYKAFLINSNRTHFQTLSMKSDFDPSAYKFEPTEPDELFVEGIIKPLSKYIINIKILKPISDQTKQIINKYLGASLNENEVSGFDTTESYDNIRDILDRNGLKDYS